MAKGNTPAPNAFSGPSAASAPPPIVRGPPAPPKFAGVGAEIQGRPGQSIESMAERVHPGAK